MGVARRSPWIGKLVIVGLLACILLIGYWYYRPATRPGWLAEVLPISERATTRAYRWKDANGQWVLSSDPPTEPDIEYETVEYRRDLNTLPSSEPDDD